VACGGGADGVEGGVSGSCQVCDPDGGGCECAAGALSVVLALTDASGSTLRVEVDPRDGRAYLTVGFDGHEAPFELGRSTAVQIAGALRVLLNAGKLGGDGGGVEAVGAVKRTATARETGSP
jgi:hypothetical protein